MNWKYPRRVAILVIGGTIVAFGAALLILPGPGIAVIIGGLALLATEFVWAARLLRGMKDGATNVGASVIRRWTGKNTPPTEVDKGKDSANLDEANKASNS